MESAGGLDHKKVATFTQLAPDGTPVRRCLYDDRGRLATERSYHSADVWERPWFTTTTGRTIALGDRGAWTVLFDNGPYQAFCEPPNPYYPEHSLTTESPRERPSAPLWMTKIDRDKIPCAKTYGGEVHEVYQTVFH